VAAIVPPWASAGAAPGQAKARPHVQALCVQAETHFRRWCARRDSNPQPSDP
jgi:hypothetical protein